MYRALISFAGKFSMTIGEVAEIADEAVAADLEEAGFIEQVTKTKKNR